MSRIFFMDGKFIPEEQALISVTTHALHYGTGVFEGIRAYFNEKENAMLIFRAKEHFERIKQSAKIMFLDIPYSVDELIKFTSELLQKNFEKTDLYIRPLSFKSDVAVGNFNLSTLKSGLVIYTVAMGRYLNTDKGISVNISSWVRNADNAIPPRGKITGGYANTCLAKTDGLLNGFDDVLQMDKSGHIVEGSSANLFMVKNGIVFTPPTSDDILAGITRDTIITLCNEMKIEVIEKSIDRSEIYGADEVFQVGTAAEVTPITQIDHRTIGDGEVGKISRELKDLFYKITHGEVKKFAQWLTKVSPK